MSYAAPSAEPARVPAAARTNLPGLFLMIVGAVNVAFAVYLMIHGALSLADEDRRTEYGDALEKVKAESAAKDKKDAEQPGAQDFSVGRATETAERAYYWSGAYGGALVLTLGAVALAAGLLTVLGGFRMRRLRSRGLAVTGALLALLPCVSASSGLLFGQLVAVWCLVALGYEDVKDAFR